MISEVFDGIYQIKVPLPENPLREVNSYYIPGPERSLLIDTGFNNTESKRALLSALGSLGADPERMDILLTHAHADHSGLAPHIAGKSTRIFVHPEDMRRLNAARDEDSWALRDAYYRSEGFPAEVIERYVKNNPVRRSAPGPSEKYSPVTGGELLHCGGLELECIHTPGHSPGHLCLYSREQGLLLSGDHILFDITPNITSWVGFGNALGRYLESLRLMRGLEVRRCLPGHRETGGGIKERIDELLEHHERRLAETLYAVGANPGLCAFELAGRLSWRMRYSSWEDFPPNQKWFAVGETLSHLDLLVLRGELGAERAGDRNVYYLKKER